jgi:hypothetical protein
VLAVSTPMLVVSFVPAATSSLIRDVQEVTSANVFHFFSGPLYRVQCRVTKQNHDTTETACVGFVTHWVSNANHPFRTASWLKSCSV